MGAKLKIKIFTHSDLDGVGAVIVAKTIFGEGATVVYETHNYDSIDKAIVDYYESEDYKNYDITYITDISVDSEEAILAIENIHNESINYIKLFDHHKTALHLTEYEWATIETEKPNCGTSLLFKYLIAKHEPILDEKIVNNLKVFVLNTAHWDTWLWKKYNNNDCKRLNDLFYMQGKGNFISKMTNKIVSGASLFTEKENEKLDDRQKEIDYYIIKKNKQITKTSDSNGYHIGVVFAEQFVSELGNDLLTLNEDIEYVMLVDLGAKRVSLRARETDDIDVSVIAESKGGGGHKSAAGFQIEENTIFTTLTDLL